MILAADRSLSMCGRGCTAKRPIGVEMGKLTPDTSARNSSFSMSAGFETASFTSTTA
jgi:hypothetical protein